MVFLLLFINLNALLVSPLLATVPRNYAITTVSNNANNGGQLGRDVWSPPYSTRFSPSQWQLQKQQSTTRQMPNNNNWQQQVAQIEQSDQYQQQMSDSFPSSTWNNNWPVAPQPQPQEPWKASTRFSPNQWLQQTTPPRTGLSNALQPPRQTSSDLDYYQQYYQQKQQYYQQFSQPPQQYQPVPQTQQFQQIQPFTQQYHPQQFQQTWQTRNPTTFNTRFTPVPDINQQGNFLNDYFEQDVIVFPQQDEKRHPIYRPRVTVNPFQQNWNFSTRFSPSFRPPSRNLRINIDYLHQGRQFQQPPWNFVNPWRTSGYINQPDNGLNGLQEMTTPSMTTYIKTNAPSNNSGSKKQIVIGGGSKRAENEILMAQTTDIMPPSIEEINIDLLFTTQKPDNTPTLRPFVFSNSNLQAKSDTKPPAVAVAEPQKAFSFNVTFPPLPLWPPKSSPAMPSVSTTLSTKVTSAQITAVPVMAQTPKPTTPQLVITPMPTAFTWTWLNRTARPVTSTSKPGVTLGTIPFSQGQTTPSTFPAPRPSTISTPPQLPPFLTPGIPKTTTTTSSPISTKPSVVPVPNNGEKFECGRNTYMDQVPMADPIANNGNAIPLPVVSESIVGGTEAKMNEFPWQVRVNFRGGFLCGGAVITTKHILTAAHCIISSGADNYKVFVGDHSRSTTERGEQTLNINRVTIHPNYVESTNQYDLAVLETAGEIVFDKVAVRPVCLPSGAMVPSNLDAFAGQSATISGWGKLREGGGISPVLQKGTVPILPQTDCVKTYRTAKFSDDMMCAGDNGKTDTCQGDSGGPLVIQSPRDGRYYLIGVTSWGYGCARANYPGVYARVASSLDWINKVVA